MLLNFNQEIGRLAGLVHDAVGKINLAEIPKSKKRYLEDALILGGQQKVSHAFHGAKLVEQVHGKA